MDHAFEHLHAPRNLSLTAPLGGFSAAGVQPPTRALP